MYLSICLFNSFNLKVTINLLLIYPFIKVQSTKYPFYYLSIQVCWLYIADYCPIPSTVYHIFFLSVKVLTVRNRWLSSYLSTIYLILCLSIYLSIYLSRFADCVEQMTGSRPGIFWRLCWKYFAPMVMGVSFQPLQYIEGVTLISDHLNQFILCHLMSYAFRTN